MRTWKTLFFIILFAWLGGTPVKGETVLDDTFNDTSKVDMALTSAMVDTVNGHVQLPPRPLSNAVAALENTAGYVTASQDGVTLYELDDSTGRVTANSMYSCPWVTDATGVAVRQDNLSIWAITDTSIAYYKFNGAGMSNDPALKASGLVSVLSVAAFKHSDSALVLEKDLNKGKVTRYDAWGTLTSSVVLDTCIDDPIAISMVDTSPDFRLFTKTGAYYFMYDDAGGTYVEDPARRITGLVGVISASADRTGNAVLTADDLSYYINIDPEGASRADAFSPGPVQSPIAVSLRPGSYEQVFLDENGGLHWWAYDDAGDRMVRIPDYEITGLALNAGYVQPKQYFSTGRVAGAGYDAVRLSVVENKPAGTSITYHVSSDGGITYTDVTPGAWRPVPRGSHFVLKANLNTFDSKQTPKIMHVFLEADENMVLEGSIMPNPAERGRGVTVSARAVLLTADAPAALDSCSLRYPLETKVNGDPALTGGEVPTDAAMTYNPASGYWEYTFAVGDKSNDNFWPDDGVYQLLITGVRGGAGKQLVVNLEISGHLLRRLIIRTVSW